MSSTVEKAVQWAIDIANDNTHGYSQSVRWGPSYDCSSLVISAWEEAGVPVHTKGATYTGNMYPIFKGCGFADVTALCNLPSGTGLIRGDVLLNTASHTAMYIGNGKIVHARSAEGSTDTRDGSGNEITADADYWNYPWNYVLRYADAITDSASSSSTSTTSTTTVSSGDDVLDSILKLMPYNTSSAGVAAWQGLLKWKNHNLGWYGIDGDCGGKSSYTMLGTEQAIRKGELTLEQLEHCMDLP